MNCSRKNEPTVEETTQELTTMLQGENFGPELVFIGSVENVYVFEDVKVRQKVIVHHDPVYDNGDIYFDGEVKEYFL